MVSYAQNREDVMLMRAFAGISDGFYVDVGANHPVEYSVTKAFYDLGWSGINIEPSQQCIDLLRKDRPRDTNLQLACGSTSGELRFYEFPGTGLSTLSPENAQVHRDKLGLTPIANDVTVKPLKEILGQYCDERISFLSIDVEGWEQEVLAGCDFSDYRPWVVLVEATNPLENSRSHKGWEHLLLNSRYQRVYFDGINMFYVAEEVAELAEAFHEPPCALDYITHAQQELQSSLESKMRLVESLGEQLDAVYTSSSWRFTKPLRWVSQRFRRSD